MCENNHYNFSCRLCLNFYSQNVDLFENGTYINIVAKINSCLDIKIIKNDPLPTVICPTCLEKIISWDSFQKRCKESQEQLSQWIESRQKENETVFPNTSNYAVNSINNMVLIKEEIIDDDLEYTSSTFTPEFYNSSYLPNCNEINQLKFEKWANKIENLKIKKRKMLNVESSGYTFFCSFCHKLFENANEWKQHNLTHHLETNLISDDIDDSNPPSLLSDTTEEIQIKNVYSENTAFVAAQESTTVNQKVYKCQDCNQSFTKRTKYASHRSSHAALLRRQQLPVFVHCKNCKKKFSSFNFKKHKCSAKEEKIKKQKGEQVVNRNQPEECEFFSCIYCGNSYKHRTGKYKHQLTCINRPKNFKEFLTIHPEAKKCNLCNRYCVNKILLAQHLARFCPNLNRNKPMQKNNKQKPTNNPKKANSSKKVIDDLKPTVSSKKVNNNPKTNVIQNTNKMTDKMRFEFTCELCKKIMLHRSSVKLHKKYCYFHKKATCFQCNKKIRSMHDLLEHNRQEHPTKKFITKNPFLCSKCKKRFPTYDMCRTHMLKHEEDE